MNQLYFQTPYKAYQEIFVFVKNALMCHYHQTEQKWPTSRDALTPYLQYKGLVHKRRHQFSGKGQLISKANQSSRGFSQKTSENTSYTSKNEFIRSFFGRILGLAIFFKIN